MHSLSFHPRFTKETINVNPLTAPRELYSKPEHNDRLNDMHSAQNALVRKRYKPFLRCGTAVSLSSLATPVLLPLSLQIRAADSRIPTHHPQYPEAVRTPQTVQFTFHRPLYSPPQHDKRAPVLSPSTSLRLLSLSLPTSID